MFMVLQRTSQEPELSFAGHVCVCFSFVSLPIFISIYILSYYPTLIAIYVSRYLLTYIYITNGNTLLILQEPELSRSGHFMQEP